MRCHLKFVITAALVCHLFPGIPLVISQALPQTGAEQKTAPATAQARRKFNLGATEGEPVTASFNELERVGDIYTLRGNVEISFKDYTLHADTIVYNSATGETETTGHVALDGGPRDTHIVASHGTYNVRTRTGKFYDVTGTTGARFKGRNVSLKASSPHAFAG